ncbi:MAG TPA: hypothetical protein VNU68_14475 [Verrucomicrobiae bacterium]|nr:hypothetical protein [Verrucomicrobiae bacterium]
MQNQIIATLCFVFSLSAPPLRGVDLIAIGTVSGTYEDFATETAAPLESGVPGNRLGGIAADTTRSLILNPNKFFVFAFSDSELPGYIPQQIRLPRPN